MEQLTLKFLGASQGVTGSCFMVQSSRSTVLVDCGMFQGSNSERALNSRDFPFGPATIDAVVLTHAHIDHSGLLPKLVRQGFRGKIHATQATVDLCSVMLPDSGHIQEQEAERRSKRERRRNRQPPEPVYSVEDAYACLQSFSRVDYGEWVAVADGIRVRYWNAGHLLGSASIEMEVSGEDRSVTRILFSGDIGPMGKLLQWDPEGPEGVDYVVCESTYGAVERPLEHAGSRRDLLQQQVVDAAARGGALLIPSFAVERTQEVLVDLVGLMEEGRVPAFPIVIDSPLATRATQVFKHHAEELEHGAELLRALNSPHLTITETVEQSKMLDQRSGFHVVISASGMCDAGRIRHRLKNWLWRPEGTVLLVGFQAAGTLGRVLLDGATSVRIHGEEISVAAAIRSLDVYSGHADATELEAWLRSRKPVNGTVFLVHGEAPNLSALRERFGRMLATDQIMVPELDQAFLLQNGRAIEIDSDDEPRLVQVHAGQPDSSNDEADLLLDISDALSKAADERTRGIIVRKLKRALEQE